MADLASVATGFGHLLHAAGVPVTPERSARFTKAIFLADPVTTREVYWLGRVTLLTAHAQVPVYDRVFTQVFRGIVDLADFRGDSEKPPPPSARPTEQRTPGDPNREGESESRPTGTGDAPSGVGAQEEEQEEEPSVLAAASVDERLSAKSFADCTPEELALIAMLVSQLTLLPPRRKGRRTQRNPTGRELDVRATLRKAHATGGDPVNRVVRRQTLKRRRVVLLADVSGSMEPFARVYLHLLRGAAIAWGAEAFVFATRLHRLTRALTGDTPDVAYRKVLDATPDWSGGTRIGDSLVTFINEHGRRGIARGAVVVIVSDGWEIGDPATLGEAMRKLSLMAHRIVWVNPRRASSTFEPRTGGMAAALPYIDILISGHSMASLDEVLDAIASDAPRRVPTFVPTPLPEPEPEAARVRGDVEGDGLGTAWNRDNPATYALANLVAAQAPRLPRTNPAR